MSQVVGALCAIIIFLDHSKSIYAASIPGVSRMLSSEPPVEKVGGNGDDANVESGKGDGVPRQLSLPIMQPGLSQIHRTFDGTGFAFTKLDLVGQGITGSVEILSQFPHIRHLVRR